MIAATADAKVFEVKITVEQADTTLRPGMTTGNAIETFRTDSVLFVPIEAINSDDGVPVVYKVSGGGAVKQEVVTGAMNDDEVIITRGLTDDDQVYLSPPPDRDHLELVRLPGSPVDSVTVGGDTAPRTPLTAPNGDSAKPRKPPSRDSSSPPKSD